MGIMDMFQRDAGDASLVDSAMTLDAPVPSSRNGKNIVFCLTGDSVISKAGINSTVIQDLSGLFSKLHEEGFSLALVVGGGRTERRFRKAAHTLSNNHFFSDQTQMHVSQAAASLFVSTLKNAHSKVVSDVHALNGILSSNQIAVYGSILPGLSVEGTAALLAEKIQGKLFILSDSDGVFAGEKEGASNQLISSLSFEDVSSNSEVLDAFTASILSRSKIETCLLNANSAPNIEQAVRGSSFAGTKIGSTETSAPLDYGLKGFEDTVSEGLDLQ